MSTTERAWFKSSYSGTEGDNCLEVAASPHTVHVRDSKDKAGPVLALPSRAWEAFLVLARG